MKLKRWCKLCLGIDASIFLLSRTMGSFSNRFRSILPIYSIPFMWMQIVEPADLDGMLRALPECKAVLTAGQLATKVFTEHYHITETPKMGGYVEFTFDNRTLRLYRMPSSSRAYPLAVEKKAEYYKQMFDAIL